MTVFNHLLNNISVPSVNAIRTAFKKRGINSYVLDHDQHFGDIVLFHKQVHEVEIKSHQNVKGYETFPAEIYQSHRAQKANELSTYLRHDNPITLVIQHDLVTGWAYIFNAKKLRTYVLARSKNARSFGATNGATGILVPWTSEEAGYITRIHAPCLPTKPTSKT